MKYTSTIRSRQFITANGKQIFINPKGGELSDEDAKAVAKSVWGKHLVKNGCLTFKKPIEVEEEDTQRGMTITEKPDDAQKKGHHAETPDSNTGDEAIPDFENFDKIDVGDSEAGNGGGE